MPLVAGPPITAKREYDHFRAAVDLRERQLFRGHKLTCTGLICSNARKALRNNAIDREIAVRILRAYENQRRANALD